MLCPLSLFFMRSDNAAGRSERLRIEMVFHVRWKNETVTEYNRPPYGLRKHYRGAEASQGLLTALRVGLKHQKPQIRRTQKVDKAVWDEISRCL